MGNQFPALAVQPMPGPLDQYAKAAQVASGLQSLQVGQIQLQQARIQQQSQATLMKAFADNKGDMNQALADATASGKVDPTALLNFKQASIAAQTSAAKLQETQLGNNQKVAEAASNELTGIQALPPDQRPAALNAAYGRLLQLGADPKHYGPVVQQLAQDPSDENLRQHEISLMGEKWVLGNEEAQRKIPQAAATLAETQAKTEEAKANITKTQFETGMQADPLLRMERNPEQEMAGDKLPAAVGYLSKEIHSADAGRAARATSLLGQAKVTQNVINQQKESEAIATQAAAEGDPAKMAQLLDAGVVSPTQAFSSRRPDYVQKVNQMTVDLAKSHGKTWDAQVAQADFDNAHNPANVAFFGSAHSLVDKGGTLDQLREAGKKLPQGEYPAWNKLADWKEAQTGSGPLAKYATVALGGADDYAKVMGGGVGSDSAREAFLETVKASLGQTSREGALEGAGESVKSQMAGRIGKNQLMQKLYGDAVVPEKGAKAAAETTTHVPGGKAVGLVEGKTGKGSDGKKYVVKGGVWVAQ